MKIAVNLGVSSLPEGGTSWVVAGVVVGIVATWLTTRHFARAKVATQVARSSAGRDVRWWEREIVLSGTVLGRYDERELVPIGERRVLE